MKKLISLLLCLVFVLTFFVPATLAYGSEGESGYEDAGSPEVTGTEETPGSSGIIENEDTEPEDAEISAPSGEDTPECADDDSAEAGQETGDAQSQEHAGMATLTVDNVTVKGILPEGAELIAEQLDDPFGSPMLTIGKKELFTGPDANVNGDGTYTYSSTETRYDNDENKWKAAAFYDIKLFSDGEVLQPEDEVYVTIENVPFDGAHDFVSVKHFLDSEAAIEAAIADGSAETVRDESYARAFPAESSAAEAVTGESGIVFVETITEEDGLTVEGNSVTFPARSFSIYAVGSENARLKVVFHQVTATGGENTVTMYVKEADIPYIDTVIYDPGEGTVPDGMMFKGWTSEENYTQADAATGMDIGAVRSELTGMLADNTVDELTVDYYAMVFFGFTITFKDETGAVIVAVEEAFYRPGDGHATITLNHPYTAAAVYANFLGWQTQSGSEYISSPQNELSGDWYYKNGDTVSVTGDVVLVPYVPAGNWLVFNENGKGATYNAPQFVKTGQVTVRPCPDSDMIRFGYTFGGWYRDEACTQAFTFGSEIHERTEVYAKWNPNTRAYYTILIWKQNISGTGYDFERSISLQGNVGSTINTVSSQGTGNNRYARINSTNYQYSGFHLENYDQNIVINAEGNSVLNVYYNRNEYTLTFQVSGYTYTPTTGSGGTQYGVVNNQHVQIYYRNGAWHTGNYNGAPEYIGVRYTRSNRATWHTIKEIKALYQQNIGSNFPIEGNEGITYNNGERWDPQSNTPYSEVLVYIDVMPAANVTFRLDTSDKKTKTIIYMVETLPGVTPDREYKGKGFTTYSKIDANYGYFTEAEDYIELAGFTKGGSAYPPEAYGTNGNAVSPVWNNGNARYVYCYYTRDLYDINYMDGRYVDGNHNVIDETGQGQIHVESGLPYGSDISSYNGYVPDAAHTPAGYVFEGWFIDSACTQGYSFTEMPKGGVTVYAKWRQIQYRVFLHPNAGTDETLDWGSDSQEMNFRVSYNGRISVPTGRRTGYEFVGWFMDEAGYQWFDPESYVLNETIVRSDYDKTTDFTDPMDKWGNGATTNSDITGNNGGDRFWITKKFDLYAKWRRVIDGAYGIHVEYDANGGSGAPVDDTIYLDQGVAVAGIGPVPPAVPQGQTPVMFRYWVIMRWNGSEYIETAECVNEGESFNVDLSYASVELLDVNDPEYDTHYNFRRYTVRLKAVYGAGESPDITSITYNGNGGTVNPEGYVPAENVSATATTITFSDLGINTTHTTLGTDAFLREGYDLIGWSVSSGWDPAQHGGEPEFGLSIPVAADNLDLTGNPDDNILYAVWSEKTVTIHYVAAGPDGSGNHISVVPDRNENIPVKTGTPDGSTASVTNDDYSFIGWYSDEECTDRVGSDPHFVPVKNADEFWTERTYYAKFAYNMTTLTITNDTGHDAVFTVTGAGYAGGIRIGIPAGQSVTIAGVYVGEIYTVTEDGNWAWRYTPKNVSTNALVAGTNPFSVPVATKINYMWLSGTSYYWKSKPVLTNPTD